MILKSLIPKSFRETLPEHCPGPTWGLYGPQTPLAIK